jgi:hypothetical protein
MKIERSLAYVNQHVGAGGLRSKAPYLIGEILVPPKLLIEDLGTLLGVIMSS